ncbi:MAG TPA: dihydrofolate reductase family protein [Candidatus Angelobacter sp.]|nr:dihydrofolate reductase family protein [Candidatus Angelobacter sp.]
MRDFQTLFDDAEPSPIDHPAYAPYGRLGFPEPHADRPWTWANFVQSIDGVASFKGRHASGADISQSPEDRWLMDLLRAHADAIIMGVNTLTEETLSWPQLNNGRGPVYRIEDPIARDLRARLGRGTEKVIFVTASAMIDPGAYRVFDGDQMQAFILTTAAGAARLKSTAPHVQMIVAGKGRAIDLPHAVHKLRTEMNIRYLLCEGGPTLYGSMTRAGLIDEKFVTVSPVEIGLFAPAEQKPVPTTQAPAPSAGGSALNLRPTTFMGPGFTSKAAPWYRWMSCHRVGDHQFNRYRKK